jgi:hypothetical protein
LHGHLNFCTPKFYAQNNSHTHNLSFDVFAGQCPLVGLASLLPSLQNIGNKNTPNYRKAKK